MFNFQGTLATLSRRQLIHYIISFVACQYLFFIFSKKFFSQLRYFCSPFLGELVYYITCSTFCQHIFCVSTKMSFCSDFFQHQLSILNIKGIITVIMPYYINIVCQPALFQDVTAAIILPIKVAIIEIAIFAIKSALNESISRTAIVQSSACLNVIEIPYSSAKAL